MAPSNRSRCPLHLCGTLALLLAAPVPAQDEGAILEVGRAQLDQAQTLDNVSFAIQDGKIREVEQRASKDARSRISGERRWYFPNGFATAGFVDVHSGLGGSGELAEDVVSFFPAFDAAEAYDPAYPGWEQLPRRGVTSLVLAPSDEALVGGLAGFVRPGAAKRPAASYMKFSLTDAMTNREREPTSLLGAMDLLGRRYASILEPEEGMPKKLDAGMERFAQTLNGGQAVGIACQTPAEILQAIRLVRTYRLNAFLVHVTEAEQVLEPLAASGLGVVLDPLSFGSSTRARKLPALLAKKNIRFAVAGESVQRTALPRLQSSLAMLVRGGVSPQTAIAAVTTNAARFAGLEERVGSLLRGRDADVVVWSHPPYDLRARPLLVLRGGEVLFEQKMDEAKAEPQPEKKGADL